VFTRNRLIAIAAVAAVGVLSGAAVGKSLWFPSSQQQNVRVQEMRAAVGHPVAAFPSQAGRPDMNVLLSRLSDGSYCLDDAAIGEKAGSGGACNPANDPLAGKPFSVVFAYEGGPTASSVKDARLYGLAAAEVGTLEVTMSDGSTSQLHLSAREVGGTPFRAYAYRVSTSDLRSDITPVTVIARDGAGAELARQATGLG
jgi:hypothetical protein